VVLNTANAKFLGELPSVAETAPFTPNTEYVHIGPGPGFFCSITRPQHFTRDKRYPVIVDVYGGPTHQQVLTSMSSRFKAQWLAGTARCGQGGGRRRSGRRSDGLRYALHRTLPRPAARQSQGLRRKFTADLREKARTPAAPGPRHGGRQRLLSPHPQTLRRPHA